MQLRPADFMLSTQEYRAPTTPLPFWGWGRFNLDRDDVLWYGCPSLPLRNEQGKRLLEPDAGTQCIFHIMPEAAFTVLSACEGLCYAPWRCPLAPLDLSPTHSEVEEGSWGLIFMGHMASSCFPRDPSSPPSPPSHTYLSPLPDSIPCDLHTRKTGLGKSPQGLRVTTCKRRVLIEMIWKISSTSKMSWRSRLLMLAS